MKHHSGQGKELRKNMYTGDTQTYHMLLSQLNHSFRAHRKEKALHRDAEVWRSKSGKWREIDDLR